MLSLVIYIFAGLEILRYWMGGLVEYEGIGVAYWVCNVCVTAEPQDRVECYITMNPLHGAVKNIRR